MFNHLAVKTTSIGSNIINESREYVSLRLLSGKNIAKKTTGKVRMKNLRTFNCV